MLANTDIERFVIAQKDSYKGYQQALSELQQGHKERHWVWYIFPQTRPSDPAVGSQNTQYYGISDDAEALRYLHHPVLGPRLAEITAVVHTQLFDKNVHSEVLMMWDVDVKKLRSCMELFLRVGARAHASELPWLPTFLAQAQAIFQKIDRPEYRHH